MTGPQDPAAAGRDRLRAGHADREQVIGALKAAFVQGRLAKDEFDGRVGQALASRTYADLAALTSDILPAPAAARLAHPPAPKRRRPLVRAAAQSGACLVIAAAALGGASILDPGPNVPGHGGGGVALVLFVAICAVLAALGVLASGVVTSWEQRRSRGQLPPRPGPGGHAPDGERHGGTGRGPAPPGPRTGPARADLRAHQPRQHRQHIPARAGRAPGGVKPAPGTV
jgi:hypothetical protein